MKMTSRTVLLNESSMKEHIDLQNGNYADYVANLMLLMYEYNIDFSILKLAKILVAALVRNDKELASFLMKDERYDLPVILKCCDILDSKRSCALKTKKTDKIKNVKKLARHKTVIANLQALNEGVEMNLTKSKIKFIKEHWVNNISKERLEYMALLYPVKYWKWIIDLFHLRPNDFQLEWFTTYVFTQECPQDTIISICNSISNENIKDVLIQYKLPYDFLRLKYKNLLTPEIMEVILSYTKLSDLVRHWSDFNTETNTTKLINRLDAGEEIEMPYGELMKRIQMLKEEGIKSELLLNKLVSIAEIKLVGYKIDIEQPVVVLGDASASMDVAVKTSSIITSILVKICNAKMHLFRNKDEPILNPPTNVKEVLATMEKFKAHSCTAPAASLYPYYNRKEVIKTFILVTDEVENADYNGQTSHKKGLFADIFQKYRNEVYPAKLVFVSFLDSNKDGQMVRELKQTIPGIEKDIIQFIMSNKNPDLRKLDELLNTLSLDTQYYEEKCLKIANKLNVCEKGDFFNKEFIMNMLKDNAYIEQNEENLISICI